MNNGYVLKNTHFAAEVSKNATMTLAMEKIYDDYGLDKITKFQVKKIERS